MKKLLNIILTVGLLCSVFALAGCNFNAEDEIAGHKFCYESEKNVYDTQTSWTSTTYTFNEDGTYTEEYSTYKTDTGNSAAYSFIATTLVYSGTYSVGPFAITFKDSKLTSSIIKETIKSTGVTEVTQNEKNEDASSKNRSWMCSLEEEKGSYYLVEKSSGDKYTRLD